MSVDHQPVILSGQLRVGRLRHETSVFLFFLELYLKETGGHHMGKSFLIWNRLE